MTDPFAHDDAAYVLGALDPAEQAAFEQHLTTCAACTERVRSARSVLPALATVPGEAFEPVPETLLPGLLRRAATTQRRRRYVYGAIAALAAACIAALVFTVWPSSGPQVAKQQMTALVATPVRASAALEPKAWGTQIELYCSYVERVPNIP